MNRLKLSLLLGLSAALIGGAGYSLGYEGILFACVLWLVLVVGLVWIADKFVLKLCNAELLTVYHSPTIFEAVKEVSTRAGLPMPAVYMMPGEAPNLFSVGRSRRHAGVVFTEGTLTAMNAEELRSAIAHEMVHIFRNDTLLGSLAATLAGFLGMGSRGARLAASSVSSGGKKRLFAFSGILIFTAPIAALIIQSLVSTQREFQADLLGAKLMGNASAMASAIRIMEKRKHAVPLAVAPAVSHLFMVNPLPPGRVERTFSVHPPLADRVRLLEELHKKTQGNVSTAA
jgi:heat shock protein HtpX